MRETYTYGRVWRAIGVAMLLLAVAMPLLMAANHEAFGLGIVLTDVALGLGGIWSYAHFRKYIVTIAADGLTIERLGRRPAVIAWRDVVSYGSDGSEIAIRTVDHRKFTISTAFPGAEAIAVAAARHLPDVAFGSPAARPELPQESRTPQEQYEHHRAVQRSWLRFARRAAVMGAGMALAGFAADIALDHIPFRALPRSVATVLAYTLAIVQVVGYDMGAVIILFAPLFLIMAAQEARRARRIARDAGIE